LLGTFFAAVALAVGAATGRRSAGVGAATVVAVLGYFGNNLAPSVQELAWVQRLSPYYYASDSQPLVHGWNLTHAAVLLVATMVITSLGLFAFTHRDLAT
jgi:ABC-2 type transport system permease protein